jgi:CheY-like chemotaxis protein
MFVQVEEPERRFRSGLGIGLTLVRSLVEMHGGAVELHSSGVGHGSEFRVHLPIVVDSPQEEEAPPPIVEHVLTSSLKVLIVDDNREAVETLGIMVERLGHDVRRAHDGHSAIDIAASFLPNVVLMDVGMPRLDGCETARRIRREPWGKSITLVALTGWGQDEDRRRTHEAGFDHHLVKPVASTVLLHLFAQEMRKSRNT